MISTLAVLLMVAATTAGAGLAARRLSRPIPAGTLVLFFLLALAPFPRGFLPGLTVLPLEHVATTEPWASPGGGPPSNPWLNDVVMQMLPWARAVRLAYAEGSLPLRDRWNGTGTPLAANGQSAAFSPFTLLTLPLPLLAAFLAASSAKLVLAMAGTWLWLREISASARSALFAAIAFALSMTFSQWIFFPHTAVYCLWPWMLFLAERCRDPNGRGQATVGLAAVFLAAALAGHPETFAFGLLFLALWLAGRFALRDLPDAGLVTRRVLLAGAAAAGLAAFLLVPTALAIRASNRMVLAALPHWSRAFSLAPHGALWRAATTAFFPRSLGDLIHVPQIGGVTGGFPEMVAGYFGIVGWAAALLFLRPGSRRSRASWVLAGLVVCGLGTAIALWPFAEIFGLVPVLRHVFPLRFYSWIALAGPALAALELDRYARDRAADPRAARGAIVPVLILAAAAILWYLHLRPEYTAPGAPGFQRRQLAITLALLGATGGLTLLAGKRAGLHAAGLAVLCAADLLYQWRSHYRVFPTERFFPETPLIRFLRDRPPPFRVAGARTALFPNTNVFAGVEEVRTHDPVERRDYVTFLDATCGYVPGDYFKQIRDPNATALDFLNARYLVAAPGFTPAAGRWRPVYNGDDGQVFESPTVLPTAFVPATVRLVERAPATDPGKDANAAFGDAFGEIAGNRDWRARAWVLAGRAAEEPGGEAELSGYVESTNAAAFDARVGGAGAWVVLSLVQDGGWSARTDAGADVSAYRANGPFLALRLPGGVHHVRLRYRPPGFGFGTAISALTLAVILVAAGARRRGSRVPA